VSGLCCVPFFVLYAKNGVLLWCSTSHITNTCAQTNHPDFREEDSVRLLSELPEWSRGPRPGPPVAPGSKAASPGRVITQDDVTNILDQLHDIIGQTYGAVIIAVVPKYLRFI
jgi:hypothetical protein